MWTTRRRAGRACVGAVGAAQLNTVGSATRVAGEQSARGSEMARVLHSLCSVLRLDSVPHVVHCRSTRALDNVFAHLTQCRSSAACLACHTRFRRESVSSSSAFHIEFMCS